MNKNAADKVLVTTIEQKDAFVIDPVSILRAGVGQETLLFESADVVTKLGEKSLLFLDIALRLESRSNQVQVTVLLDEAMPLLKRLAHNFSNQIVHESSHSITLAIEPLYHQLDLLQKMRTPSALNVLRQVLSSVTLIDSEQKKHFMLAGAFSFDFLDHFEKLPRAKVDRLALPDFLFYLPLTVIVIDHRERTTSTVAHAIGSDILAKARLKHAHQLVNSARMFTSSHFAKSNQPLSYHVDIKDDDFKKLVDTCKSHILAGDVYQIVPSRTFSMPIKDPILSYQALRHLNPSPYMFFMKAKDWTLFGASPETFIKVDKRGSRMAIRPIAGTRRRGFIDDGSISEELDSREQASLCLDEKELAEHMMLVDLARNDIASVSKPGSRRIRRLLSVDRFSHVMHLVSEVEGVLRKEFDALSAYQASMNMGTLMGAPKVRSAELLRELEASKRGFYGGAVGYLDALGNMDTSIIIRSALVKDATAYVRAGCGVVFDSTPQFETQET